MALLPLMERQPSPTPGDVRIGNDLMTMLTANFFGPRSAAIGMPEPFPVFLVGVIFSALAGVLCIVLIAHRARTVRSWQKMAYMQWFVMLQFTVAACFMVVSAVMRYAYDSSTDVEMCRMASKACIIMYTLIKGLFYILLADRLHVVRTCGDRRIQSKLCIFHYSFIVAMIVLWNIVLYCRGWVDVQDGVCVVGAIRDLFLIVIVMDVLLNLYLTTFFLYYLNKSFRISSEASGRKLFSSQASRGSPARQLSAELRTLTIRTVVGLVITLTATLINAVSMIVMNGEAMWFCFIACKADILVNVVVLFWITLPGAEREAGRSQHGDSRKESDVTATTITLTDFSDMTQLGGGDQKPSPAHLTTVQEIPEAGQATMPTRPTASRTQSFAEFLRDSGR